MCRPSSVAAGGADGEVSATIDGHLPGWLTALHFPGPWLQHAQRLASLLRGRRSSDSHCCRSMAVRFVGRRARWGSLGELSGICGEVDDPRSRTSVTTSAIDNRHKLADLAPLTNAVRHDLPSSIWHRCIMRPRDSFQQRGRMWQISFCCSHSYVLSPISCFRPPT